MKCVFHVFIKKLFICPKRKLIFLHFIFADAPKAAAELAAKKSRVKQSLIKRARSVAIFSLKLKERRAREAEKQALNLAEQEKVCDTEPNMLAIDYIRLKIILCVYLQVLHPQPPGGELDMIGIEQLIQIDDIQQKN